jgi:lipid II:glycine glycyltransferase (peptidoglycan interpeptide bridge formation enzyme)
LIDSFGEALKIRVAFNNEQPIAAILTLRYKDTLYYKYGCSDAKFHGLGGMHLLLWRSIREAKEEQLRTFDLGRSDWEDKGLITFKDRWGAKRSVLTYLHLLPSAQFTKIFPADRDGWKKRIANKLFLVLPDRIYRSAGDLIYKHIG